MIGGHRLFADLPEQARDNLNLTPTRHCALQKSTNPHKAYTSRKICSSSVERDFENSLFAVPNLFAVASERERQRHDIR